MLLELTYIFSDLIKRGASPGSLKQANNSGWMKGDIFPKVLAHFISSMAASKKRPGNTPNICRVF